MSLFSCWTSHLYGFGRRRLIRFPVRTRRRFDVHTTFITLNADASCGCQNNVVCVLGYNNYPKIVLEIYYRYKNTYHIQNIMMMITLSKHIIISLRCFLNKSLLCSSYEYFISTHSTTIQILFYVQIIIKISR